MISEKINDAFIDLIQKHTPADSSPAIFLSETLNIGREAAYRRLRGEVLFTLSEASILSSRLHLSLDAIMGMVQARSVLFQLGFDDFYSTLDNYSTIIQDDINFFQNIASHPDAVLATAGGAMPAEFYMRQEHVAKFKYFRWLYQHGLNDPKVPTYEDLQMPDSLVQSFPHYIRAVQEIPNVYYIFDNNGFKHWVNAIRAFRAMHLISDASIRILKEELLLILRDLEEVTKNGGYANGNKVSCYISDIDLESTYKYVLSQDYKVSTIGIFSLNSLRTGDPGMFDQVKRWVQTQARFSTLISGSGELQRLRYFKRQHEVLETMEGECF